MISRILVICIGNICRSPLGEAILVSRLESSSFTVSSAGIAALVNEPAHPIVQRLALSKGYDLSAHRSRQLTSTLIFDADLILTMDEKQQKHIENKYPNTQGKVYRIGKWSGFDVPDPFTRPEVIFKQAFALIEQGIDDWIDKLKLSPRCLV